MTPTDPTGTVRGGKGSPSSPEKGSGAPSAPPVTPAPAEPGAPAPGGSTGSGSARSTPGRWVWAREALLERNTHPSTPSVTRGTPGSVPIGDGTPDGNADSTRADGQDPDPAGADGRGPGERSVDAPAAATHGAVGEGHGVGAPPAGPPTGDAPRTPPDAHSAGAVGPAPVAATTAGAAGDVEGRIRSYEDLLLGGHPSLSAREMAARTGTPLGRVDEFWLAMGFRTVDPDEVVFTVRDLEAYGAWSSLIDSGAIDLATGRSLLRAQSHISDRLALWQVEALVEDVARRRDLDDTQARRDVLDSMGDRVDFLEHALVYSWRRQLESLIARVDREVTQRGPDSGRRRFPLTRSLGFVDMVSYTSSSTILGGKLVGLIERFEDASRTAVTAAGGRVVKMIGDAVLFIADDLTTGLRVVTSLIEALGADDQILPVRASFVRGDVFSRSGDVFGPPVNLASRLVDIAPEGRILTDATTAAAIAGGKGGSGYHLEDFPSAELRGFGTVSPYLLARDMD